MDDKTLQDLKQFITVTVNEATADLVTTEEFNEVLDARLNSGLNSLSGSLINEMRKGVSEVQAAIADTFGRTNEVIFDQLDDHEKRIGKLEKKPA